MTSPPALLRQAAPSAISARNLSVGGSISPTAGGTFAIGLPRAQKQLGYVVIANPTATINVKRVDAATQSLRPANKTSTAIDVGGGKAGVTSSGPRTSKDNRPNTTGSAGSNKITAAVKHKFESPVFTDAMGEVGPGGGSIGVTVGGEWENVTTDVKFTILALGEKNENIKITEATASATVRDIITVGSGNQAMHFQCSATFSFDVKPNKLAIAKWLVKKGVVKAMKSAGARLSGVGATPMLFLEGGYRTLEAAYKNVRASKNIKVFLEEADRNSREAAAGFIHGACWGFDGSKLGAHSGAVWSGKAYEAVRGEHPGMTLDEFREALRASTYWQEQARAQIAHQAKVAMYEGFAASRAEEWSSAHLKLIRMAMFNDEGPPVSQGVGAPLPEIVKLEPLADVEFLDDDVVTAGGAPVPPIIQNAVRRRVDDYDLGTVNPMPHEGIEYRWRYDRANQLIHVHGGHMSSVIAHRATWM